MDVSVRSEIAQEARVHPDARIGPFCTIGPGVSIGPRTVLSRRVTVMGRTTVGADNYLDEGCVLGGKPQDLKYRGGRTELIVGDRNRLGRNVTAHIGTELGGGFTWIGSDTVLMDSCHVAHDCYVEDGALLGRKVLLAGHIHVQTGAVVGDLAGAHHFTTVGRYARVGPRTPVRRDVPPFTMFSSRADGSLPAVRGIHEQGVRAANLTPTEERDLRRALVELFQDEAALATKIEQLVNLGVEGEVASLCAFCQQSLQGVYGRYRELFRNQAPPEALRILKRREQEPFGEDRRI